MLLIICTVYWEVIISIGIAPEIGTTLNKNSKIIKITDNEIEFTFNLNNDTEKKRLIVKTENNDIHFKLEDVS